MSPCPDCPSSFPDLDVMTTSAVFLAGLVDGFNPCAFTIAIVLAGVLAVGHTRRARWWGGFSFCAGSFLTYVAMGLGLLRLVRALPHLGALRLVFDAALSLTLFVLAFLSVRDALAYRRARRPEAIVLQLPDWTKRLIRRIAERSWSGPSVMLTGLVCGIGVTVLDSLCTGQVYVPIVALLSGEAAAMRRVMLLLIYNLAFISPIIVIFGLAARGVDGTRMSRWSKRNVIPAKVLLAAAFFVLALLTFPDVGAVLAERMTRG